MQIRCKLNTTLSVHQVAFLIHFFLCRTSLVVIEKKIMSLKNNDASSMSQRQIKPAWVVIACLSLHELS